MRLPIAAICALALSSVALAQTTQPAATTQAVIELKPTAITLDLDGAMPEEAFKELSRQAGISITVEDPKLWEEADPIILKVKDAGFWPTLFDMAKQSGLTTNIGYGYSDEKAIKLYNKNRYGGQQARGPSVEANGMLIMAQSAQRNYSISYGQNQGQPYSNASIQLQVLVDPGIPVLQVKSAQVKKAVDENGLSIAPPQNNNGSSYGMQQGFAQHAMVNFKAAEKMGKKIVALEGVLPMTIISKAERIEIENPLKASEWKKSFARTDVTISQLKSSGGRNYQLKLNFKAKGLRRSGRNDEYQTYYGALSTLRLEDAQGNVWRSNNGGGGGGNGGYELSANFFVSGDPSKFGDPVKLSWLAPVETKEIQVPFTFKDLAFP